MEKKSKNEKEKDEESHPAPTDKEIYRLYTYRDTKDLTEYIKEIVECVGDDTLEQRQAKLNSDVLVLLRWAHVPKCPRWL